MAHITTDSFDRAYKELIRQLFEHGIASTTRKGKVLTELHDCMFTLKKPRACMATRRDMSIEYLQKEFEFYMSGSDLLKDAVACSPFWEGCSDDGVTINSNYGKLLFHDRNRTGHTQFEHALNCLKNSKGSKKAVMTIYDKENAYISNDNPCTMFLKARIDQHNALHLTVVMRSSDIYYGLPYDVPFFVFVQHALLSMLKQQYPKLTLGTYTHFANSLHFYDYKHAELVRAHDIGMTLDYYDRNDEMYTELLQKYLPIANSLVKTDWMAEAWRASKQSNCMKKQVGCVLTEKDDKGVEKFLTSGYGDIAHHRLACTKCVRDDDDDKWFETGCPSVHAEHRCLENLRNEEVDYSKVTAYVTHGPCDSCLKMLDYVGVNRVFYDKPYKTDYGHWPSMMILPYRGKNDKKTSTDV